MIVYDPLRPPHIITLRHSGFYTAVARCRCDWARWGTNEEIDRWIVEHRRAVFPRFRA